MLTSWIGRERFRLLACSVGALCLVGCGGQEFSSNSGGSGNSGGNAGSKATGGSSSGANGGSGVAGDDAMGGSPDTGGTAGTGGVVSSGCACLPGQYCRDASSDCFDCTELSRLRFHTPERLDAVSSDTQASHFPRVGESSTDLVYSATGVGLRYTTDSSTSAGSAVAQSVPQDSGPLLLEQSVSSGMVGVDFNFVFDRQTEVNKRVLFFGQWQGGLTLASEAPGPYNGGSSDYSMAIATNPSDDGIARAFWMTDRDTNLGLTLVTGLFTANSPGGPVNLSVGQASCAPEKADLSPWVTPDGKTLLFSTTRVDGNCTTTNQGKDIYTALLQPATGQPTAAAVPVSDVNGPGNDVDPSFSRDFCDLYFASDRDGAYAVYRAHRR